MGRHSSGQARITLGGRVHYLGAWGSPEAHSRYGELVKRYLDGGRQPLERAPTVAQVAFTVANLFQLYRDFIEATGKYLKGGRPTTSRSFIDEVMRNFGDLAGDVPVHRLTEALVVQWRDRLEGNRALTRRGINRKVTALLAILRWGRARGHVDRQVWAECSAIVPLKRGECGNRPEHGRRRRPPSFEDIDKVAAAAPRQVFAMMRLQALTGMRPGEVCQLRWCDIDKNGPTVEGVSTWVYTVDEGKTAHHGQVTRYPLPPAAQKILEQFPRLPAAFVFSPRSRMAERRRELRHTRKTKTTKQTRDRDRFTRRDYSDRWSTTTYRHAVEKACARGGVERFTPHQIRHAFATWAANTLGVMVASVALNHRHLATTQRYLHPDPAAAFLAAAAVHRRDSG